MPGRGFLEVARDTAAGATEFHWRASVIHAYYALVLECRDALLGWGFTLPRRENMHTWVRLRFIYASDSDLQTIGRTLEGVVQDRNRANYDLQSTAFTSPQVAQDAVQDAVDGLTLLDQIDADPVRRVAAIAAIPP